MNRHLVRTYRDASFIFDREKREALFFAGSLATFAPAILDKPDEDPSGIIRDSFPGIPQAEWQEDLHRMTGTIRSFLTAPAQHTDGQDAHSPAPIGQLFQYARKHSQVITANIELTHWCNQRCATCFLEDFNQQGLDEPALQRILGQLRQIGAVFVSLTGGEIFTRPDALDLIAAVNANDLIPEVKTNGIAITPSMIASIAKMRLLDLQISMYECQDGWSALTKTKYPFSRLLATIQDLQAAGVPVTVSVLVGTHNIDQLPQYHERLAAVGINNVFYSPYLTQNRQGNNDILAYRLSAQELQEKLRPFLEARGALHHPKQYRGCGKQQPTCYAGRDQLAIDPKGDVYPCLDLRIPMGNVLSQDLRAILRRRQSLLGPFLLAAIPTCQECRHKKCCDSCVGAALLENGDFRIPSQHKCDMTELYCSATNQRKEDRP